MLTRLFSPYTLPTCLRKYILLVQILAAFPACGILLPDVISHFTDTNYVVPLSHLVSGIILFTIIMSAFIIRLFYAKTRLLRWI